MERTLVVVFDSEKKAYEGKKALQRLDGEGSITLYANAVVTKSADGTVAVKDVNEPGPLGTVLGTTVGGLVALLGGPAAALVGATSGLAIGSAFDLDSVRVGEDFIEDVSKALAPKKAALIAEIDEEWTTPLDTRMEEIGGTVFRRALSEVQQRSDDEEIAAMKADVDQMKAEAAKANADRKAKLQQKVSLLETKIQIQKQKAKDKNEAFKKQQAAKKQILKKNAAAAGKALRNLANTQV
ncbi:MAG TPA: DUF1269 domain-containing protein [Thermoanaerobaculia bacterium]|nr:DUF1269 domain-containing protein [Thermoanaerobaculia bacterium]